MSTVREMVGAPRVGAARGSVDQGRGGFAAAPPGLMISLAVAATFFLVADQTSRLSQAEVSALMEPMPE